MGQEPQQLEYSRQPAGSIAQMERRGDGSVVITIPPPMYRPLGKIILAAQIAGVIVGPLLWVTFASAMAIPRAFGWLPVAVTCVSYVTLPITLWMGFRWTIIEAGAEGLRLTLRGLLMNREWFLTRDRIGSLRKGVSLIVLDPRGRRIGKIDATTPAEEVWIMETIGRAMGLPVRVGVR